MAFGDYQLEIYLQGLSGVAPSFPMSFAEWEAKAQAAMPRSVWSYVAGGSGDERTQRVNRTAFDNWGLMPRMFNAHRERDLSVEVFGLTLPSPVFMAPIGVIGLCSQDSHGESCPPRRGRRVQGHHRHAGHLGDRMASVRPVDVQLPTAAQPLPGELQQRPGVPGEPAENAGGRPASGGAAVGLDIR